MLVTKVAEVCALSAVGVSVSFRGEEGDFMMLLTKPLSGLVVRAEASRLLSKRARFDHMTMHMGQWSCLTLILIKYGKRFAMFSN